MSMHDWAHDTPPTFTATARCYRVSHLPRRMLITAELLRDVERGPVRVIHRDWRTLTITGSNISGTYRLVRRFRDHGHTVFGAERTGEARLRDSGEAGRSGAD